MVSCSKALHWRQQRKLRQIKYVPYIYSSPSCGIRLNIESRSWKKNYLKSTILYIPPSSRSKLLWVAFKVFGRCVLEIHTQDFTFSDFVTGHWNLRSVKANVGVLEWEEHHLPPWGWSRILSSLTSCELGWAVLRSQHNLSPAKKAENNIGYLHLKKIKQGASVGVFGHCNALSGRCGALQNKGRFDMAFTAVVDGFIRLQWHKSIV